MSSMAALIRFCRLSRNGFSLYQQIRGVRTISPVGEKTLNDVLAEENAKDPIVHARVDIGLYFPKPSRQETMEERKLTRKKIKENEKLGSAARLQTLKVNLDEMKNEWRKTNGPNHVKRIADHYGIFEHLFSYGYFTPYVMMDIAYEYDDEHITPVNYGNIISPLEASTCPIVNFDSPSDNLWTLVLTNLDGHLLDNNAEYLHWLVGNIKGCDISSGDVVCDYLQPFPFRGTGYHRFVFVLYKQDDIIDYSSLKKQLPCLSLKERTFITHDFYKEHQDVLTPAGLSFFQSTYEESLIDFFHNTLQMREPVFEYEHKPLEFAKQKLYPHKKPFHLYLDRYRDPKQIRQEVLSKRFESIHPFEEEPPPPKHPNIYKNPPHTPSWRRAEIWKERNRLGKYRDLRPYSSYPESEDPPPFYKRPYNS